MVQLGLSNSSFVFDNASDTLNTQNLNSSGTIQGVEILGSGGLPAINTFNVTNYGSSAYVSMVWVFKM